MCNWGPTIATVVRPGACLCALAPLRDWQGATLTGGMTQQSALRGKLCQTTTSRTIGKDATGAILTTGWISSMILMATLILSPREATLRGVVNGALFGCCSNSVYRVRQFGTFQPYLLGVGCSPTHSGGVFMGFAVPEAPRGNIILSRNISCCWGLPIYDLLIGSSHRISRFWDNAILNNYDFGTMPYSMHRSPNSCKDLGGQEYCGECSLGPAGYALFDCDQYNWAPN